MFIYKNPNPLNCLVGDCVIRAISILTMQSWDKTYDDICEQGHMMCDMPSSNSVWDAYLRRLGYRKHLLPDTCPDCYTVREFCEDHPNGRYMLATGTHVVTVINGDYYDTWDSGDELPVYYYERR